MKLGNSEKITPYFLGLAKCSQIEASLDDIVNNEGEIFENCETREQFIRKNFEDLYKKPNENVPKFFYKFVGESVCTRCAFEFCVID